MPHSSLPPGEDCYRPSNLQTCTAPNVPSGHLWCPRNYSCGHTRTVGREGIIHVLHGAGWTQYSMYCMEQDGHNTACTVWSRMDTIQHVLHGAGWTQYSMYCMEQDGHNTACTAWSRMDTIQHVLYGAGWAQYSMYCMEQDGHNTACTVWSRMDTIQHVLHGAGWTQYSMYCMEQDGHNTACTCMYVVVVYSFRGLLISVVRAADVSTHLKMLV